MPGPALLAVALAASLATGLSAMAVRAQVPQAPAGGQASNGPVAAARAASAPASSAAPGRQASARPAAPQARGPRLNAVPAWTGARFVYRAEGKRLADVLQDFAASQGLPAVVAEDLEGVVNGNFDVKTELFLDNMARTYNMLWYHDGTALYFYPGRAIQSRMFRLKGFRRQQVMSLLQSLDVGDKRYPIRYDEAQSTLYVSGPPRHVELVTTVVETLDAGMAEAAARTTQVFALKFATAGDRLVGGTTVPGVASTLRRLFAPQGGRTDAAGMVPDLTSKLEDVDAYNRRQGMQPMPKLGAPQSRPQNNATVNGHAGAGSGTGSSGGMGGSAGKADVRLRQATAQGTRPPADRDELPPMIEADEGTNAVVIQGRADRMAEYGALIERLDQKPMLVELVATIIEVSSDSIDALGVNWSASTRTAQVSLNGPVQGDLTGLFTLGTVVANAGRELLARVNALQSEGKARILSKPSVLGVANRTAVMREKRIATVRVSGSRDANLFQVEAGTLLEMTPQVTPADGLNRIKLSIYIEDGNFESTQIDQIPIVKKTEIRTEAHVREGESLLIAGITVESDQSQNNGVPGLSRVPVVGGLFRSNDKRVHRTERMFLITPRLPGSAYALAAAAQQASLAKAALEAPRSTEEALPSLVARPVPASAVTGSGNEIAP